MTNFQAYPMALRHPDGDVKIIAGPDQEKHWLERGYERPGQAAPSAFLQIQDNIEPDAKPDEWPKFVNGKVMHDPDAPPPKPKGMYPLMRDGKIIATEEDDMDALMEADAEMRIPAAQRADERDELVKRAQACGVRFDARWGLKRLREVVEGGERAAGKT